MAEMHKWAYNGPIMSFTDCIQSKYRAETMAVSEAKARANIAYQFKLEHGLIPATKISAPGKLVQIY